MEQVRKVLGLIPAKGGSTRLPRKNIVNLGGRPLLAWTADAARKSGVIDRLIVSTEDEEIADLARSLNAEVPFRRPLELARDPAGVVDVALHALEVLEQHGEQYQTLIIMLPTCPFRNAEDIQNAYSIFKARGASFLMSVAPFSHTPFAALKMDSGGYLKPYFPDLIGQQSQTLPTAYRPNGALHILEIKPFRAARSYFAEPLLAYVMPQERSIDIDNEQDLRLAESMLMDRQE